MPLPDERPRASVANLIGRFERSAQRRASSGELAVGGQQPQSLTPRGTNVLNRVPKSPISDTPSWLKSREKAMKEKEERQALERAQLAATQPNVPEAPISVSQVEAEGTSPAATTPTVESNTIQPLPEVPREPAHTNGQSSAKTPPEVPSSSSTPKVTSRSSFATPQSLSRVTKTDSAPILKSSRSTSALKSTAIPPSAFKSAIAQFSKPQPPPIPSTHTAPLHRPLASSRSASAIRKPRPSPSPSIPARAVTPQASRPRTPPTVARPKTPSALHAPTASSLAKSKSPPLPNTGAVPKVVPKPALPASPARPRVPTTLRTSTSPTPSGSGKRVPSRTLQGQPATGKTSGKKPLILGAKTSKPAVPASKTTVPVTSLGSDYASGSVEAGNISSSIEVVPTSGPIIEFGVPLNQPGSPGLIEDEASSIEQPSGPSTSAESRNNVVEQSEGTEIGNGRTELDVIDSNSDQAGSPHPVELDGLEELEGTEIGNGRTELDMIVSMLEGPTFTSQSARGGGAIQLLPPADLVS